MSKSDNIKLSLLGLPVMATIEDFSKLTHISVRSIYHLTKYSSRHYFTYDIPKKSGGLRTISQPSKRLKGLQSWVLFNILNNLKVSNSCKGFEKGTSVIDNVVPHINSTTILSLDLKDFFSSIKSVKIFNIFRAIGYNDEISTILTNLCTVDNGLPQGGPCSPKLANLSAWPLDVRIQGFVGKRGITYTRYADDLTFSANNPNKVVKIIAYITSIVEQENLKINPNKTRIAGISRQKKVTGLVISEEKFGIGRQKYKELRRKIHYLTKPNEQLNLKRINEVQGWLSYLYGVDKRRYFEAVKYIVRLKSKKPDTLLNKISYPIKKASEVKDAVELIIPTEIIEINIIPPTL